MNALFIQENSLNVTLVTILIFLLSLSTQMLVPLQAAYVTQPQTRNVRPTASSTSTPSLISLPLLSVGQAIGSAYSNSSVLGFQLTGNIYDDSSSGFMIAHRGTATSKVTFTIHDPTRLNAVSHQLTFTDYGNVVIVGGRLANPTEAFYEYEAFTPLGAVVNPNGTISILHQPGNMVALNVPFSSLGASNDYFVMESLNDNGHTVVAVWGITQYGTYASGVYFDMRFWSLGGLTSDSYVIRWQDTNGNGVADSKDTFTVVYNGPLNVRPLSMPTPPSGTLGCYGYVKQAWKNVACESQDQVNKIPPPSLAPSSAVPLLEGGGTGGYGVWGFRQTHPYGLFAGEVTVWFFNYNGETDTQAQAGSYSIQLNTNTFLGNNGHKDWVQFTVQNSQIPGLEWTDVCVWQVDTTVPTSSIDYHDLTKCMHPVDSYSGNDVTNEPLTSSYAAEVHGIIVSSANQLQISVALPSGWSSMNVPDFFGLGTPLDCSKCLPTRFTSPTHWISVSGTILGTGSGSAALFSGLTDEDTFVSANCGPNCQGTVGWSDVGLDLQTAEINNLFYTKSCPTCADSIVFGGSGSAPLWANDCVLGSESTYPQTYTP